MKRHGTIRGLNASDLAMAPDDSLMAIASEDGSVRLHDATTGDEKKVLEGSSSPCSCVVWHPSSVFIACGHWDGAIEVFEPYSRKSVGVLRCPSGIRSLCWSADGLYLACGLESGEVFLFETSAVPSAVGSHVDELWRRLEVDVTHRSGVIGVCWNEEGRLATVCGEGSVVLGRVADGGFEVVLRNEVGAGVEGICWTRGGRLLVGCSDGSVRVLEQGKLVILVYFFL